MEMKPGRSTTEFWVTVAVIILQALMAGVSQALNNLSAAGISAPWFGAVLAAIGMLGTVMAALGYVKNRTRLKAAHALAEAGVKPSP